ncbi:MFS transporter [Chloroflexota bacterium]
MKSPFLSLLEAGSFLKRQHRDWKVTVVRTSLDKFAYQMIFPYLSIYIVALGANATKLGIANSIGMILAGLCGPFTGWFIDIIGPKKIYLLGISMMAISHFTYGISHSWPTTIIAMAAYWLGHSVSVHSCSTICGNCLANEDRAKGMTFCETIAAGLLGMAGPMVAVWLVMSFGGVNASGIRPIFFFALISSIGSFFLVLTQLSSRRWTIPSKTKPNLFRDLHQVLQQGNHLKRWLIIASIGLLPLGMVFPFSQVFAHEIKGANEFVLGAMVTGSALLSIVLAIPLGRIADQIGRKKVLYTTITLFWASNLVLLWAPNTVFLIIAGVMQGFYYIGAPIQNAMERELVPAEQMGRWVGISRFFRMILSGCLVFVGGVIWDNIGPQYVFLTFVGLDLILRMPLLISMPETLGLRVNRTMSVDS